MSVAQFISGFLGASTIEIIASISGFICVFLLIRRSIWNWLFGLVQVTLFVWIFYHNKLYSDALLNFTYIGFQCYGWWNWLHHQDAHAELIVEPTTIKNLLLWLTASLIGTMLLGFVMHNYTDASFAYTDAYITCTSLVAQWLLTRRQLFNWLFWIVVDIVAIAIYLQKGLYPTSVLYFTFLIMSCVGQFSWWQRYRQQHIAS